MVTFIHKVWVVDLFAIVLLQPTVVYYKKYWFLCLIEMTQLFGKCQFQLGKKCPYKIGLWTRMYFTF